MVDVEKPRPQESRLVVFARGEQREKVVDGQKVLAYPIACYSRLQMGTGLAFAEGGATFWGLAAPRKVITSYRGMKIAELVEEFGHGTLAACWHAGQREVHPSDQEYVDEIEAKIGKQARERILGMLPENFDEVLTLLRSKNISFAGWEVEEEVKSGLLKVTPAVQSYLDAFHRKQDETKQEELGRIITLDEARAGLREIPFAVGVGKAFLDGVEQHLDATTAIAIRHRAWGLYTDYIIGKSKEDGRIEITIKGGILDPVFLPAIPILQVGLQYDGNDIGFKPTQPQQPNTPTILSRLAFWRKPPVEEEPTIAEKFAIFEREYGATITPEGRLNSPRLAVEVKDKRVGAIANALRDSIKVLLGAAQAGTV